MGKPRAGNSGQTAKRKAGGRPFKPGQSGNLNGRPKLSEEQKAARLQAQAVIDAHTVEAAWVAVEMLHHSDFRARHVASSSLLDRASIKGVDRLHVAGPGGGPIQVSATREKLADRLARLLEQQKLPAKADD